MSLNANLSITGQKSGAVKGGVTQKGRENTIAVYSVQHEIVTPRDPQSGLPTGKRMHKPLIITKEIDPSSPILLQILVTNENITNLTLKFCAAGAGGQELQTYTIRLTNANIASIDLDMRFNKVDGNDKLPVLEVISFTYERIDWLWTNGGISSSDDWEARV